MLNSRLAAVHVLVADSDMKIALLVKSVLNSAGFQHIHIAHDGSEGIYIMENQPIDLVITDWPMRPVNGMDFLKYLRSDPDSPNRTIPVIMLTAKSEMDDVVSARDVGVTEYVVKPFSPKSLFERLIAVVENPRSFILTKSYAGPNRRRRGNPPPGTAERRVRGNNNEGCIVVTKSQLKELKDLSDTPIILQPDYDLKQKIGPNLSMTDLLRPEQLEVAERAINEIQSEFMEWIKQDMAALEFAYQNMVKDPEGAIMALPQIRNTSFSIKSRAGTFGYLRGSEVAQMLHDFCSNDFRPDNRNHLVVIQKHIETLHAIFMGRVISDGGAKGAELMEDLHKLIEKYK